MNILANILLFANSCFMLYYFYSYKKEAAKCKEYEKMCDEYSDMLDKSSKRYWNLYHNHSKLEEKYLLTNNIQFEKEDG